MVSFFSIRRLKKATGIRPRLVHWLIKPALAATLAGLIVNQLYNHLISEILPNIPAITLSIAIMMGIYGACIVLLGIIRIKDIKQIVNFRK
jgi:hypothetical protein